MIPISEIHAAQRRIAGHVVPTPVAHDERLGAWLKWESRQLTHSFKPRGALNKVLSLDRAGLDRGLIACSAGNHGQGTALAARIAGSRVAVYVPAGAAQIKIDKMLALGAEVIRVPGQYGDAEAAAIIAAREQGRTYVSPYNDPLVMAGAGTIGLEWLAQTPALDILLIPVGGGGLIAGAGSAAKALRPGIKIIGVQSEASAYLHAEFHRRDMSAVVEVPTLTDGLAGSIEPGSATIGLIHEVADDVLLVTEEEIERAIAYAFQRHGEVVEGSAAVVLAAALAGRVAPAGEIGLLITGGNIDAAAHARICAGMVTSSKP